MNPSTNDGRTRPAWEGALGALRASLRTGAGAMRLAADVANLAALAGVAYAALFLWGKASFYWSQSGGIPDPRAYGCVIGHPGQCGAFLEGLLPTLHYRLYWLALSWVFAVVAVGFAVLAAGGLRWAYWRVHDYLAA